MSLSAKDSIVVTGMGVVTPAGCTLGDFWTTLCAGESTAAPLSEFDVSRHRVRFGCQVRGFDQAGVTMSKDLRRMDPFAQYGVVAAMAAFEDAGRPVPANPTRAAIVAGNAVGGRTTQDQESRNFVEFGPSKVHPLFPIRTLPNATAALTSIQLGWRGPALSIATACASGADAIGQGRQLLRMGLADIVLAGGCEASLTPVSMAGFANMNALSTRNDDPTKACRPFDIDRDGLVMGEGAGFVVLERLADARARGARLYALLTGYAANCDAHHLVMPPEGGPGAVECMSAALADADLEPWDIVHVNCHGTSTPQNDRAEASALRKVFGPDIPPITSTKGVIGHLIGAAGAVEFIAAVLTMRHATVPPTANHEQTEPDMNVDVVHGTPRSIPTGPVLTNSFGMGGHNACLVVEPV